MQNESPAKVPDVQIDITPIASSIVDEIIEDVLTSISDEPSVPAAVLHAIDKVIEEAEEEGGIDEVSDLDMDEKDVKRENSVSEIIHNLEKMREQKEKEEQDRQSPRRTSSSSPEKVQPSNESAETVQERSESPETVKVTNIVKIDDTNDKGNIVEEVSGQKQKDVKEEDTKFEKESRELEIQTVKVQIADEDEKLPMSDVDDLVTIHGQPVPPHSTTIIVNGHISRIKDSAKNEIKEMKEKSKSPERPVDKTSVPQTDIDSLETKVEPLDISNPDDDSSDQRSDTGSINTVDSIDKEEPKESPRNRNKGHIKSRSVSFFINYHTVSLLVFNPFQTTNFGLFQTERFCRWQF